jgi:rhodanese-related sulfurtransferase
MPGWISRLTLNQKLALTAVALGAVALFANPHPGSRVTLDAKALALAVGTEADHVEAPELAAWIIEGRADYRLIDLRTEAEFTQYHIPTAVSIPMNVLTDAGLGRQEKLVLYSEGGIHSAQAWMLLKAQGYKAVYMLKGGLEEWKDQVVDPVVADTPSAGERARDERLKSISAFFGGQPRSASAVAAGVAALPGPAAPAAPAATSVVAPPSPAGGAKPAAAKKKKEGC